jgi:hypothetical protein
MSDLRDFTGKNRIFTGSTGERISLGDTGSRVNVQGTIRFNTTTNLMEYYSGTDWKAIDAPPIITNFAIDGGSNITSGTVDNEGGGTVSIAVNGSLFDTTGASVTFVGTSETLSAVSTTRNSANLLTCTFTESEFDIGNSPYTLKVSNGSGLSAELAGAISADQTAPTFTNAADTTVNLFDSQRGAGISAAALCGASGATSFAVTTGSLPSGLSMTSGTGAITGTASAVGSDTTSTFTVTATGDDATSTRQFKITVKAPQRTTYNSTGSFTHTVPSGATAARVLVIGGGGGGGRVIAGGGGAGGMVESNTYPVTPGGTIPGNVGGGAGGAGNRRVSGDQGGNSAFGSITAIGGGGGTSWSAPAPNSGGSGGGGSSNRPGGAPGNQGDFNPVNATGYGYPGYNFNGNIGGGGGGAGGGSAEGRGTGGSSRDNDISGSTVAYAGGGGGGGYGNPNAPGGGGGAGSGGGNGGNASNNRGSGGGGGYHPPDYNGGSGGSGIVIINY